MTECIVEWMLLLVLELGDLLELLPRLEKGERGLLLRMWGFA